MHRKQTKPQKATANARPTFSSHFDHPVKKRPPPAPTVSPHFAIVEPFTRFPTPPGLAFALQAAPFGLIQERICADLFALVIQAILWNKTKGVAARPVLWTVLSKYPNPVLLANASEAELEACIRVLGLQRRRARRLIAMAAAWLASPPCPERRYAVRSYPRRGSNPTVKDGELLGPTDEREGWEIAHLPGVGEYALDSFRIFGRDRLRGLPEDPHIEPEWKRVVPSDKELGPYIKWKWAQEGWDYHLATGARTMMQS